MKPAALRVKQLPTQVQHTSGGNIRYQAHFEQRDGIFQLQLAFFESAHLQLIEVRRAREFVDHMIEIPVFHLQFNNALLNRFNVFRRQHKTIPLHSRRHTLS